MADAVVPLALAYEMPDMASDRRDRGVLWLARACVIAQLCSLAFSLFYIVDGAVRAARSAAFLLWTPVVVVLAAVLIRCVTMRPRRGLDAQSRRRVMRWWWVALFIHLAISLISTAVVIVMRRPAFDLGVEAITWFESVLRTAGDNGYLLLVPLLFDRPVVVYLRRLSLLATVLVACTAVVVTLSLGRTLAVNYSSGIGALPGEPAIALMRMFAAPLGYTAAAALMIGGTRSDRPRRIWFAAGAVAAATWLVTTAPIIGHPWYQWQSLKTEPLMFMLSWLLTLSTVLWRFGPLALLLWFTGPHRTSIADDRR